MADRVKARGVRYAGHAILAATRIIQLKGKDCVPAWPDQAAAARLKWPMKGWKN